MYYKCPQNKLHYLDDDSFKNLLPEGSIPVSDKEAAKMQAANLPKINPQDIINAEAKDYLSNTDWIVIKLSETIMVGGDFEALKEKYSKELTLRAEKRNLIKE